MEVKGKTTVVERDLRGLRALAEERRMKRLICVSLEDRPRRVDGLEILPYGHFLDALWAGEFSR